MTDFFIEKITLHAEYNECNIKKILLEGQKHGFMYKDDEKTEQTQTLEYGLVEEVVKKIYPHIAQPKALRVKIIESWLTIWFYNKNGLLSLSIDTHAPDKTCEDEWGVYPDSHYYLRQALKLVAPFCIKSIETVTTD
jgi:hypothetical protein